MDSLEIGIHLPVRATQVLLTGNDGAGQKKSANRALQAGVEVLSAPGTADSPTKAKTPFVVFDGGTVGHVQLPKGRDFGDRAIVATSTATIGAGYLSIYDHDQAGAGKHLLQVAAPNYREFTWRNGHWVGWQVR